MNMTEMQGKILSDRVLKSSSRYFDSDSAIRLKRCFVTFPYVFITVSILQV